METKQRGALELEEMKEWPGMELSSGCGLWVSGASIINSDHLDTRRS